MTPPALLLAEFNDSAPVDCEACPMPADVRLDSGTNFCTACAWDSQMLNPDLRVRRIGTVELIPFTPVELDACEGPEPLEIAA